MKEVRSSARNIINPLVGMLTSTILAAIIPCGNVTSLGDKVTQKLLMDGGLYYTGYFVV